MLLMLVAIIYSLSGGRPIALRAPGELKQGVQHEPQRMLSLRRFTLHVFGAMVTPRVHFIVIRRPGEPNDGQTVNRRKCSIRVSSLRMQFGVISAPVGGIFIVVRSFGEPEGGT